MSRSENRFLADALLDLYGSSAVATSVMLRGIAGFGPRHQLRTDESLSMSEDPPVAVVAVDTADKITGAGRAGRRDDHARTGHPRAGPTDHRVGTGGSAGHRQADDLRRPPATGIRQPGHHAVCDALHRHGFAGATVFLGVDGTAHGQRHRARFFSRNVDVPVMVIAIGTGDQVARAIPELEGCCAGRC